MKMKIDKMRKTIFFHVENMMPNAKSKAYVSKINGLEVST
jgi:hypothetical protein